MRVKNRLLLTAIWRASGQLRRQLAEAPRDFGGVIVAPYKNGARAAACVSADFELCWAWREKPLAECDRRGQVERANVPFILDILEQAEIPITWATVGHMFLENCRRSPGGTAHPEMPRPPRNDRWAGDWYVHDPCFDAKTAPGWYAPDMIRMIQASKVHHEIGTHSFSHIDFAEGTSTTDLVRCEIEACIRAMEPFGVRPRSLVFCFNHMGYQHLDLLYQLGIIAVRHRDCSLRLAYPERTPSGVYKLYESMNLRLADKYAYVDKGRVFIDEAIKCGTAYHLWFHPSDDRRIFQDAFVPIVQYLAAKQQRNEIWVTTMSDLASYREAREQMRIERQGDGRCDTLTIRCSLDKERFGDPEVTLAVTTQNGVRAITARGRALRDGAASLTFRSDCATGTTFFNIKSSVQKVEIQYSAHH